MEILVIGSANIDMVVRAPRLPVAGETILGGDFRIVLGGKGANQAVAARLGGSVRFIARAGNDLFGEKIREGLQEEGILIDSLQIDPDRPSGVAVITIDDNGENSIVVAGGANLGLTQKDLEKRR